MPVERALILCHRIQLLGTALGQAHLAHRSAIIATLDSMVEIYKIAFIGKC